MRKYIKYFIMIAFGLSLQGCMSHNVEPVNLQEVKDHRELFIANQTFECQNAFFGGAHKALVNKDDIFRAYKLTDKSIIISLFGNETDFMDENTIFLKHSHSTFLGGTAGFLVHADGTFVYDRAEQLGAINSASIFMFNIDCKWEGKTPFEPLSIEKFKELGGK